MKRRLKGQESSGQAGKGLREGKPDRKKEAESVRTEPQNKQPEQKQPAKTEPKRRVVPVDKLTPVQKAVQRALAKSGFGIIEFVYNDSRGIVYDSERGHWKVQIRVNGIFTEEQYADHETRHLWLDALDESTRKQLLSSFWERIGGTINEENEERTDARRARGVLETGGRESELPGSEGVERSSETGRSEAHAASTTRGPEGVSGPAGEAYYQLLSLYRDLVDKLSPSDKHLYILEELFCFASGAQNFAEHASQKTVTTDFSQWKAIADAVAEEYHLEAFGTGDITDPIVAAAVEAGEINREFYEQQGFLQSEDEDLFGFDLTEAENVSEETTETQTVEAETAEDNPDVSYMARVEAEVRASSLEAQRNGRKSPPPEQLKPRMGQSSKRLLEVMRKENLLDGERPVGKPANAENKD